MKTSYQTETYNPSRAFFVFFPIFIVLTLTIIYLARFLHEALFAIVGWIALCTIPFLFQKKFQNLFSREAFLEFDNEKFYVKELKNDILKRESFILWSETKYYKCNFTESNKTFLTIYLKNGKKYNFIFCDNKNQEQAISEKSVFSIFYFYVTNYNSTQTDEGITITQGFFSTKQGTVVLWIITIIVVIALIKHFISHTPIYQLLMPISILVGLFLKREGDKKIAENLKNIKVYNPFEQNM